MENETIVEYYHRALQTTADEIDSMLAKIGHGPLDEKETCDVRQLMLLASVQINRVNEEVAREKIETPKKRFWRK